MSLRLRTAVRQLLEAAELNGVIQDGSPLGKIRALVAHEEQFGADAVFAPGAVPAAAFQLVALVEALSSFKRAGSVHFVGCTAERDGKACTPTCARAQLALSSRTAQQASHVVAGLLDTIAGLKADRTGLRRRLMDRRRYLYRILARAKAETGFELRPAGRPRSKPITTEAPMSTPTT